MLSQEFAFVPQSGCFAHWDAYRLSTLALREAPQSPTIVVDLSSVEEITTSAFARLILLRRQLLRQGRDLRLTGLHARAARHYEINRLQKVLPQS
jgi:anti-anti-sigma regulatory factor